MYVTTIGKKRTFRNLFLYMCVNYMLCPSSRVKAFLCWCACVDVRGQPRALRFSAPTFLKSVSPCCFSSVYTRLAGQPLSFLEIVLSLPPISPEECWDCKHLIPHSALIEFYGSLPRPPQALPTEPLVLPFAPTLFWCCYLGFL